MINNSAWFIKGKCWAMNDLPFRDIALIRIKNVLALGSTHVLTNKAAHSFAVSAPSIIEIALFCEDIDRVFILGTFPQFRNRNLFTLTSEVNLGKQFHLYFMGRLHRVDRNSSQVEYCL